MVVIGVAALLISVAIGGATVSSGFGEASPASDAALIANFGQHRAQFARAVQQFAASGQVDAEPLDDLGLKPDDVLEYPRGVVTFTASSGGFTESGFSKGYAYSEKPLRPLVKSTDGYDGNGSFLVYRHIEGPWYIYYDVSV